MADDYYFGAEFEVEEEEEEEEELDSSFFVTESHPILTYANPEAIDYFLPL